MKIAITGGIGSGKSYLCKIFREHGIDVYDCDSAAKRIMREDAEVVRKIKEAVGEDAYTEDGKLNKSLLSSFLLASAENASVINGIVHPAVADDFLKSGINVMECAILFQSGFDRIVDKIICVSAPLQTRVARVMHRDSISREKAMEWISCQMSQEEMERRSNLIVDNPDADDTTLTIYEKQNDIHVGLSQLFACTDGENKCWDSEDEKPKRIRIEDILK